MTPAKLISCLISTTATLCIALATAGRTSAEDKPDPGITLAEGKIVLKTPKEWIRKKPSSRIVEHEFETPAVEGDKLPGRVTAMGAGGSVEANIERWVSQFSPGGDSPKVASKVEKLKIAEQEVHFVDISGTYKDAPGGPFSGTPAVLRENYRMLGAIIVTKNDGNYFVKYYGPKATVTANKQAFQDVVSSLKVK